MRPIKLEMTAFGPYVGSKETPVTVDFEKLGSMPGEMFPRL